MKNILREKLAKVEHIRWSEWQKYIMEDVFKIVSKENDIITLKMPTKQWEDWEKLVKTPYNKLKKEEKDSDREEVGKYWYLVENHIRNRIENPTKKYKKRK